MFKCLRAGPAEMAVPENTLYEEAFCDRGLPAVVAPAQAVGLQEAQLVIAAVL